MAESQLHPSLLFSAYSKGYFPMPDENSGEILWYRPDPRAIFPLDGFHSSRSLRKIIRREVFDVTHDECFPTVMRLCADRETTWINRSIIEAYTQLHVMGAAHSIEVWQDTKLVGGLYGVSFGGAFFAESMFSGVSNASKVALYHLIERLRKRGFTLLEVQFLTPHLATLGAIEISDNEYMARLSKALEMDVYF